MRTLVWFRDNDLRVRDHLPLVTAASSGEVIPAYVLPPELLASERAREAPHRTQYLLDALTELAESLIRLGSRLLILQGPASETIPKLVQALEVTRVLTHRRTEPGAREEERRVEKALGSIPLECLDGETLIRPEALLTQAGKPFSVFTPFAAALMRAESWGSPRPAPSKIPPLPPLPAAVTGMLQGLPELSALKLVRNPRLVPAGEAAAHKRLRDFLKDSATHYASGRDQLGAAGTSRLSQDLRFGTLSIRSVWSAAVSALGDHPTARRAFLNELTWREFAYYILWHHPLVLEQPFRTEWRAFPWRKDERSWTAWVEGTTGYPVVDAAARQLLSEGFVHNRARMVSASFLAKHLLIDFRQGEAHYLRFLTDGDPASNDLGWQWATGCGVDAQPWFRVFNPVLQGEKFDADGSYVRRWLPELARLPARWIHQPWKAPAAALKDAGVELGVTYPQPIVPHAFARQRFLETAKKHLQRDRP